MSQLPEGWVRRTLLEVAEVTMGQSPPGESYNENCIGKPFFQGKAEFGPLHPTVRKWTTAGTREAKSGDILMSVRAPVGPTNVADVDCVIGRGLAAIRAREDNDQSYLLWALRSIESEIAAKGTGTTFSSITGKVLKSTPVALPPLPEQRRIVEILEDQFSRLDAATASIRAVRERAEQFRKSLLQAAFSGALNTTGQSTQGELPAGWSIQPLIELCANAKNDIVDGPFGSNLKRSDYQADGIPVLKVQNIKPNRIILKKMDFVTKAKFDQLARHSYRSGDIIMTKLGDPLGVAAIAEGIPDGLIVADLVRIRPSRINLKFLCFQLNSPGTQATINSLQKGTTRPRVNIKMVRDLPITVPPEDEQRRIVQVLEEQLSRLEVVINTATAAERRLVTLRRSILHAAFSGFLTAEWRANHG